VVGQGERGVREREKRGGRGPRAGGIGDGRGRSGREREEGR